MKVRTLTALLLLPFLVIAQSVTTDSSKYNNFKNEIGIDFQNVFRASGILGGQLIYKRKIGAKTGRVQKALRIQGNLFVNSALSKDTANVSGDLADLNSNANPIIEGFKSQNLNSQITLGIEWQFQRNRFQYFCGFDTGFGYSFSNNARIAGNVVDQNNVVLYRLSEIRENENFSLNGYLLGGAKYFLTPRLSLSVESALNLGYSRRNVQEYVYRNLDPAVTGERKTATNNFVVFMDYLRYLNLSYSF